MGRVGEQDIHDGSMKKLKKKKNKESISSNEEVHNVQDVVGDLNSDSGAGKTPEKEKIMQDGSIIDATHRESDNKRKRKREKNKVRDEGESSSVLEAPKEVCGKSGDIVYSERKSRKKDKSCVDEINVFNEQAINDGEKGGKQAIEEGQVKEKKKKKRKNDDIQSVDADCNGVLDSGDLLEIQANDEVIEKGEAKKKKKKSKEEKKEKRKNDKLEGGIQPSREVIDKVELIEGKKKKKECDDSGSSVIVETNESAGVNVDEEDQKEKKKKKKKKKEGKEIVNGETDITNEAVEPCDRSASPKKMKKVTFSEQDEVFPVPKSSRKKKQIKKRNVYNENGEKLIRGKRFSKEEDEILKKAVFNLIEKHQLGENGVEMVLNCRYYPELKNCWKELRRALPLRPLKSIYHRVHTIFERSENCKWTAEEKDYIIKYHEKHGPQWKKLGEEMGKFRLHVKDTWRRVKLANLRKGDWSQGEYQQLFDLVNLDLSMKVFQEKKTRHGMLRDNIGWETISQKIATRDTSNCCIKWYSQLSSPLVSQGEWSDTDDYRLLIALTELDASCEDDVDWDNLLEHRLGDVCRERWKQMVRHIGYHCIKPFIEQVEVLSKRYCPEILEAREEYEKRPAID